MFNLFNKKKPRKKEYGRLGYPTKEKGVPDLEFMSELEPPYGLNTYRKMRINDPIVGGLILQIENIMRQIDWSIEGENADFFNNMFSSMKKDKNWLLYEMSGAFTYGFYIGEKIWEVKDGKIVITDVSPRFQPSITKINDKNGNVRQETTSGFYDIPYNKCVHHMFFSESRSPFGTAILRHIYKPYYYKINVEASESSSIDRKLSGIPVMTAPEGFDFAATDPESPDYSKTNYATLSWALDIVGKLREDSIAGVVKPHGWELDLKKVDDKGEVSTNDIISRYNTEMAAGLLENFISLGAFATTNNANTEVNVKNFLRSCDTYASLLIDTVKTQIIDPVCRYNDLSSPEIKFNKINREKLTDLAGFFARLVSNGIISPTTTLEKELLQDAGYSYSDDVKTTPDED
jgi:hypothetical protein